MTIYKPYIEINEGRINYMIREHGVAVVGVPSSCDDDEVSTALEILRSKYDHAELDCDGDIIVTNDSSKQSGLQ